jgi:hypothetical protein
MRSRHTSPIGAKLTYNADSFGEAYHVAAAAILDPTVSWNIKDGDVEGRERARQFFRECGLSRTHEAGGHATKATGIVGREFKRRGAGEAQRILRERWLATPDEQAVITDFAKKRVSAIRGRKILFWNRFRGGYEPRRNTKIELLDQLATLLLKRELAPIVVSSPLQVSRDWHDLTDLWTIPGLTGYRAQMGFILHLQREHAVMGSIGNKSGAMDGPALLGMPTLYFEDPKSDKTARMEKWLNGVVPGYERQYLNELGTQADEKAISDWLKRVAP